MSMISRNTRIRTASKPKRLRDIKPRENDTSHVALLNVTRQQVQAWGRGVPIIFNPGDIGKNPDRNAVQFPIEYKTAKQMHANRREYIKAVSVASAKKLLEFARELEKKGSSDPYFSALARGGHIHRDFPKWAGKSAVDAKREDRILANLRKRYSAKFGGEIPEQSWSASELRRRIGDFARQSMGDGWSVNDDSLTDDTTEPDFNHHNRNADLEEIEDEPEEEEEEIREPEPVARVAARVENSEDAVRAELMQKLKARGINPHGRTGTEKLKQLLANEIAKSASVA